MSGERTPRGLAAARTAVVVSFTVNGFVFSNWAARVPDTRARLGLDTSGLGLLLLCMSVGSLTALALSGRLVQRLGPAGTVGAGTVVNGTGLLLVAVGVGAWASVPVAGVALFLAGAGIGLWDVAMNVEAAEVERRLGRTIMPRFHAAFSGGTVLGAGVGALLEAVDVPLQWHLGAVAVLAVAVSLGTVGGFLPDTVPAVEESAPRGSSAWTEPRTLLIGLMVLALALTEGTANDWLAVALEDGYDVPRYVAVLGFALFVVAMTVGRVLGPPLLDRHGRVPVLWATMVCAGVGVLLLVLGGTPWLVVPGIALWGLGASLGFPVGMSAAADDPGRAAARVSVVSTIGYTAFLAGPPLLGFLGDEAGALRALLVVAVLLVPAALVVPSAREDREVRV
ncbi:MFS transporter [Marmoricola endophyticus]|uniref:MFS transporter n=1 Tax=Marmoricola endophyticus TaxID=2040280 RepID=A0A917BF23_9ACTN|nr:MFS transporter [Marmoricola endophyticus]GGF40908.1 MFS transporter [Marmoricola endophyticus]